MTLSLAMIPPNWKLPLPPAPEARVQHHAQRWRRCVLYRRSFRENAIHKKAMHDEQQEGLLGGGN